MRVRLMLKSNSNPPGYDVQKRTLEGEWERGWPHIEVDIGVETEVPGYAGAIMSPLCIPIADCKWWAPVRELEVKRRQGFEYPCVVKGCDASYRAPEAGTFPNGWKCPAHIMAPQGPGERKR